MDDNTITRYEDVEIDDIPRNLRFYPSDPSQAHTLSSERIEAYNRDGYIKGMRIFSGDEIDDIRSYFDALLKARPGIRRRFLLYIHRTRALRSRMGSAQRRAHRCARERYPRAGRDRLGFTLFL